MRHLVHCRQPAFCHEVNDSPHVKLVHGVGVGVRLDVSLFAFLERASLRMDLAQSIGLGRGPIVWFGLNQVF